MPAEASAHNSLTGVAAAMEGLRPSPAVIAPVESLRPSLAAMESLRSPGNLQTCRRCIVRKEMT